MGRIHIHITIRPTPGTLQGYHPRQTLLKYLTTFPQIIVERGATITQWSNAVNIMIEKDKGHPTITRL
jgi:hypothetical protein